MIDFREHKDLIRKLVAKEDERDKNWNWSVKSVSKNKVNIRWGYLDYLECSNLYFTINARKSDESEILIVAKDIDGEFIDGWFHGGEFDDGPIDKILGYAVRSIAGYAHNRY